ncbi:MAG: RHS repeat-associated core domain-containing protein [Ignavibacteria bacterium]|nr:hypothetical protein [Ignavibacteria bacterium]
MMEKYDNFLFSLKHQPARLVAAGKLTKDSLSLCKLRHKRKYDNKLNKNSHIKYDYRNLITQIQHKAIVNTDTSFYLTYYSYDEAGNRFAKTIYKYTSSSGPPEDSNPGGPVTDDYWDLYSVEIYSRDISGKELAIYKDNVILEYPLYGLDMIGKIKNDELFFYYKDHLGSVRATVNSSGEIVSAQDYDAWGYLLQDRVYVSDTSTFKFTSKERDSESDYDYFGARYYDSRIGRWGTTDPLLNKYPSISPYNYTLNDPLVLIDPNGLWIADYNSEKNKISVTAEEGDNLQGLYNQLGISADDFAKTYNINDIDNYNVESGVSNFDITNYVLANSKFDASFTGSNCHGFVYVSKGLNENEVSISGLEIGSKINNLNSEPLTGDIAIFEIGESFYIYGFLIPKGEPGHSAIFVIQNKSGEKQFLNRIGTKEKVTLNSENQINLYQQDIARRYRQFGANISSYPKYYRGIEK